MGTTSYQKVISDTGYKLASQTLKINKHQTHHQTNKHHHRAQNE